MTEQTEATTEPTTVLPEGGETEQDATSIIDLIQIWNEAYPDNDVVYNLTDIRDLINAEDLTDREVALLQTLLSWMVDLHHYSASLSLQTEMAKGLLKKVGRRAEKGQNQTNKKKIFDQVLSSWQVLDNFALDLHQFHVNAIGMLTQYQQEGTTPTDLANQLLEVEQQVEEAERARKAEIDAITDDLWDDSSEDPETGEVPSAGRKRPRTTGTTGYYHRDQMDPDDPDTGLVLSDPDLDEPVPDSDPTKDLRSLMEAGPRFPDTL